MTGERAPGKPCMRARLAYLVLSPVAFHAFLSILIQLENFALFIHKSDDGLWPVVYFLVKLPFSQLEHILWGLMMLAIGMGLYRSQIAAALFFLGVQCINLYSIINQLAYPIYFDHLNLSMVADQVPGMAVLIDSIKALIHPVLYVNTALLILSIVWQLGRLATADHSQRQERSGSRSLMPATVNALCTFFLATAVIACIDVNHNLERHPVMTLARSAFARYQRLPAVTRRTEDLYALQYGVASASTNFKDTLPASLTAIRESHSRPNIVFIVLESVGSIQVLNNGRLTPDLTPNLYDLSSNMIIFDAIYNTFPGTTRTHLPLNTGGITCTFDDLTTRFSTAYHGPALVNEFKQLDYRTALFSAGELESANLIGFYRQLEYDELFEPVGADEDFVEANRVHSWGVNEDSIRRLAVDWIDETHSGAQPFFLQFLTVSTHHPYGFPEDYQGPFAGDDPYDRYRNSIHYNDWVIGRLLDDLRQRNLIDNTIIFIAGDHGQAFGVRHPFNFTHGNFLYEENIKNFLLVIDRKGIHQSLTIDRVCSIGDVMPTILSLVNAPPPPVPGQNLFADNYSDRMVYFHKLPMPSQWGLRDGNWKFIGGAVKGGDFELYDLARDPMEKTNLAVEYPDRLDLYHARCGQWYLDTNEQFSQMFATKRQYEHRPFTMSDLNAAGITSMTFGCFDDDSVFSERLTFHPDSRVVIQLRFGGRQNIQNMICRWKSPDNLSGSYAFRERHGELIAHVIHSTPLPMAAGKWTVTILSGERRLATGTYQVADATGTDCNNRQKAVQR